MNYVAIHLFRVLATKESPNSDLYVLYYIAHMTAHTAVAWCLVLWIIAWTYHREGSFRVMLSARQAVEMIGVVTGRLALVDISWNAEIRLRYEGVS